MISIYLIKRALLLSLMLSVPVVLVCIVAGLLIGFLQAVMQLQDQALPFGVKLVAAFAILVVTLPWMSAELVQYSEDLFNQIALIGR